MNDEIVKVQKYKTLNRCTYHGENPPILVCKLVAEERKSDGLSSMLSGGLWGIVSASSCGGSRDRHSVTEVSGTDTTSVAALLLANVSTAWGLCTSGMTCSSIHVSPSISVFEDGSPSNPAGDGVRRLSGAKSEGNEEKDNWEDVGTPSISPA